MRRMATWVGIGIITLAWAGSTRAAPITFFGEDLNSDEDVRLASHPNADAARDAFEAILINNSIETFEAFTSGARPPLTIQFAAPNGETDTAILQGGGLVLGQGDFQRDPPFPPLFDASPSAETYFGRSSIAPGVNYYESADFSGLSLEFDTPQGALGFYATDVGDFIGQLVLTLGDGVTTRDVIVPHTILNAGGSVLFFGIADRDNSFTQVTFSSFGSGVVLDSFGFDNFTIARPEQIRLVPEPATLISLTLGAAVLAGYGWRRRVRAPWH